jgi:hypothetical protein
VPHGHLPGGILGEPVGETPCADSADKVRVESIDDDPPRSALVGQREFVSLSADQPFHNLDAGVEGPVDVVPDVSGVDETTSAGVDEAVIFAIERVVGSPAAGNVHVAAVVGVGPDGVAIDDVGDRVSHPAQRSVKWLSTLATAQTCPSLAGVLEDENKTAENATT